MVSSSEGKERVEMVKVSVIIASYNSARFLPTTLDSVFNQTYKDFEIVLVDDGSTDNTKEALKPYLDKIRYFYQENKGPSAARNLAIKNSNGQYLAFIDSDDIWLRQKLEKQVDYLDMHPKVGLVHTAVDNFGSILAYQIENSKYKKSLIQRQKERQGWVFERILFEGTEIGTSSVMIRKQVFEEIGSFDESLVWCEDADYWLRIAKKYPIAFLEDMLTKHRRRSTGLTAIHKEYLESKIIVFLRHIAFLPEKYPGREKRQREVLAFYFYDVGHSYYHTGSYKDAAKMFKQSFKHYKKIKPFIFLIFAYLKIDLHKIRLGNPKRILGNLAMFLFRITGVLSLYSLFLRRFGRSKVAALYFHHICDIRGEIEREKEIQISNYIKYIKKRFQFLKPDEFLQFLNGSDGKYRQGAILTLDDGYKDNLNFFYEILRPLDIIPIIFITVSNVESNKPFWWDMIEGFADLIYKGEVAYEDLEKKFDEKLLSLTKIESPDGSGRNSVHHKINTFFSSLQTKDRDRFIKQIEPFVAHLTLPSILSWEDIGALSEEGVEIGAHTLRHPNLAVIPEEDAIIEIKESKSIIEKRIGKKVRFFSYPTGIWNEKVKSLVKDAGYETAFITERRILKKGAKLIIDSESDRFLLPRIGLVYGRFYSIFRMSLTGG